GQRVGGDRPLLAAQGVLDRGGGVGGPAVGDGPAGGGGLDGFARLEDVGGLVRRHRAHQRALAGGEGEQVLGGQAQERLVHGGAAEPQFLAHRDLTDGGAAGQVAADDRVLGVLIGA